MIRVMMMGARMERSRKVEDDMLATCPVGRRGRAVPATANQGIWGPPKRGMAPE